MPSEPAEKRLHVMTLVNRFVMSVPALFFILLPVLRSPDSTAVVNLLMAAVYAAVVLPWVVVHYVRFRYRILTEEIIIHSGVFTRRRRSIPVERIQNVDIERKLFERLTGTARVRIYTAGSPKAEGALDVVALEEAYRIRAAVQAAHQALASAEEDEEEDADETARKTPAVTDGRQQHERQAAAAEDGENLFAMAPRRVWLSGCFRFSLLYMAVLFSTIELFSPDLSIVTEWLSRGRFRFVVEIVQQSPWTSALLSIIGIAFLGWFTGIVLSVNRFHGFSLRLEGQRVVRRHGLLSIREGAIPLRRVQVLIIRTNALMRRYGWYALDVQTMGTDVQEQGHATVVPFGTEQEVMAVADRIRQGMRDPGNAPEALRSDYRSVSRLTVRRAFVRYALGLVILSAATGWFVHEAAYWGLVLLPLAWVAARLRYRHMGFALEADHILVKRGVWRQTTWIMPVGRTQVIQVRASPFQRRLSLKTVYVDSAGASPTLGSDIIDLPAEEADLMANRIYSMYRRTAIRDAPRGPSGRRRGGMAVPDLT